MKKTLFQRKLRLDREVIRVLTTADLRFIQGGARDGDSEPCNKSEERWCVTKKY